MGDDAAMVIGVVVADLERSPIGTGSRLLREFCGEVLLRRTVGRLRRVKGLERVVVLAPGGQMGKVLEETRNAKRETRNGGEEGTEALRHLGTKGEMRNGRAVAVEVVELVGRPGGMDRRVRVGRAWNLYGWRGGAGQYTVFDEDYHPRGVWEAVQRTGAGHVLVVAAHAGFVDVEMTGELVEHHLHKNRDMRLTYTAAAPGLCGMVLQAGLVKEMAEAAGREGGGVLPGELLGYDPKLPGFDTLTRDACMQVEPGVSKLANRFLLDTERAWDWAERVCGGAGRDGERRSAGELARAVAEAREAGGGGIAGRGGGELGFPREVELELTGRRVTRAVGGGGVPEEVRCGRGEMDVTKWVGWLGRGGGRKLGDDVLVTLGGDGDPLLYKEWRQVARAGRAAGALSVCVQTDLIEGCEELVAAVKAGEVDVVSVMFYGDDERVYAKVGGFDGYRRVMANMERLVAAARGGEGRGTGCLVVPRLLKVRETVGQLEAFFDRWVQACGWAVIDGPTDRAGQVVFAGVVDMAPPKRRACRRIDAGLGRMVVRSDGMGVACDQDMMGTMGMGNVESCSLEEMWMGKKFSELRVLHAEGRWGEAAGVCAGCREWHRA